jgi:hypothetical protein
VPLAAPIPHVAQKKHQEVNRLTLCKPREELAARPANGNLVSLQQLPRGGKHILVIDHHVPMPDPDWLIADVPDPKTASLTRPPGHVYSG